MDRAGDLGEEHRLCDALEAQALRLENVLKLDEQRFCLGERLGLNEGGGGRRVRADVRARA